MPFWLPSLSLHQCVCYFEAHTNSQNFRNKKQILSSQNALMITISLDQLSLAKATEHVPQAVRLHPRRVCPNLTCRWVQPTVQGWPTGLSCQGHYYKVDDMVRNAPHRFGTPNTQPKPHSGSNKNILNHTRQRIDLYSGLSYTGSTGQST